MKDTFALVVVAVPVQLALALGMSMMLRHVRRGRDLILWIWSIPLGISDLAAGLVWLAILTDKGYLNTALFELGVIPGPQSWLTYETPVVLFCAILTAELWRATAIVFVILVAGVQLVPKEFEEAASVFGATAWQRFRRVTLPLLRPSIQTALILRTVLAFEAFAVVLAIGGSNFPVLISQAFIWQNQNQDYGIAAAYAVIVMVVSLAATASLSWWRCVRARESRHEASRSVRRRHRFLVRLDHRADLSARARRAGRLGCGVCVAETVLAGGLVGAATLPPFWRSRASGRPCCAAWRSRCCA